jgi:hypothetical protein
MKPIDKLRKNIEKQDLYEFFVNYLEETKTSKKKPSSY